jgi:UDP-2-acetamido-2-deoxy-ribo-hexuluronate aminotransferase
MASIPFVDLKAQYERLAPRIKERIQAVLEHGKFIMGPEVAELEKALCDYTSAAHCISCASGTDALLLGLMAKGVGPGDAILTSPFTFIATAEVVSLLGATPVFVDIDPRTFNLDPKALARAIEALRANDPGLHPLPQTVDGRQLSPKGVIAVDLFGLPADYPALRSITDAAGLFLMEDGAQSLGGSLDGGMACNLAEIGATSFFPAKPLGGYGDGGAVFTADADMAAVMRSLRVHGAGAEKYDNVRIGVNARLDTLQAAILLAKLEVFPDEIDARRRAAALYDELLSGAPGIRTPYLPPGAQSAFAQYSILTDRRADLQAALKDAGVPTAVYYPCPLHLQTAFSALGYKAGDMPVSEDASARILSLPMHPYLAQADVERICSVVAENVK